MKKVKIRVDKRLSALYTLRVMKKETNQMKSDDNTFIADEHARINPTTFQSQHSSMVQSDMKAYALKAGLWPNSDYKRIIRRHAEARGWTQKGFTGMEIIY
jgi:hypothetical protein